VKDPELYLAELNISLPGVITNEKPAILDVDSKIYVNYEIFFFSDSASRKEFLRNTVAYCGALTDPVSRVRFLPIAASPKLRYKDRLYYFYSDSSLTVFESMPAMYSEPTYQMLPPDNVEKQSERKAD